MKQKSFDIDDAELVRARKMAKAAGVSLNKYLLLAVVEKNNSTAAHQGSEHQLEGIHGAIQRLSDEMGMVRVTTLHSQELNQANGKEILALMHEALEAHRQQVGEMLRQFLHVTRNREIAELDEPPPPTGKHTKKASWQDLPVSEPIHNERK